jgi:D-lactate dehydrogenase
MALYARIGETGEVQLINHLGVKLGDDPEKILDRLEHDDFTEADIDYTTERAASNHDYARDVREIDADTPGRFNADPKRLFEASGSAGKVMIFAVRLDTFPKERETKVFYIGTNSPAELTKIRRHILAHFSDLPVEGEYLHRVAFDIAENYGKDTFLAIHHLGTGWLPTMFALKGRFDAFAEQISFLPQYLSDKFMQAISQIFPKHLPKRMREYRDRYEHHLMLKMAGTAISEARSFFQSIFPSTDGDFFECTPDEGKKAFLHRFAAASAAIRYRAIHHRDVEDIVALDIALRRDDQNWVENLPNDVERQIIHKLYYGHFFCHVFHQDYIIRKGRDTTEIEHRMLKLLDARGAEYPAEHNVGHLYEAKPALIGHYRSLDPYNCFNPGIGRTSKSLRWQGP